MLLQLFLLYQQQQQIVFNVKLFPFYNIAFFLFLIQQNAYPPSPNLYSVFPAKKKEKENVLLFEDYCSIAQQRLHQQTESDN